MDERLGQFVERMGLFFEAEGFTRIGGRLFAYLLLQEGPCSLDELTDALQVSKTSISTNARLLEEQAMIRRVSRPGDRRDYYVAAQSQTNTIERRLVGIEHMSNLMRDAADALPAGRHAARTRLASFVSFNEEISGLLRDFLSRHEGE